jgi:8-oxo-dGTP pyrophosphatase MutT (NUDIX family)
MAEALKTIFTLARKGWRAFKRWLPYRLTHARVTLGARALVIRDGQTLLVRHTYTDGWYTIGGGIDAGESPSDAACRELMEEVGIVTTAPPVLLGVYLATQEKRDDYVAVYVCTEFDKTNIISPEIAEEKWFPLDALPADVSPATRRRIEEYQGLRPLSDRW